MKNRTVEILAPAGSYESMVAAVNAGADAVYIGGSRFGARAYANNLDEETMVKAIDFMHIHGCRIYMTVNTLVKEKEMWDLYSYLKPYYEAGLDAVLVQDMGALTYIRKHFPDLPVHISTQMTVTGKYSARDLKSLGAVRVVPARELSLKEIREIYDDTGLEVETFVHGALCYCYSGQCLFSSLIGGRSGNRGRCAQTCRLPFDAEQNGKYVNKKNEKYLLSLKDLCTLDLIPDILESGVCSLKIEGRMKSPRYTAGVVSIYRKYVDLYLKEGRAGYHVDQADRDALLALFDRGGQSQGYYRAHNGRDMVVLKEKPEYRDVNQELFDYLDRTYVNTEKKIPVTGNAYIAVGNAGYFSVSDEAGNTAWEESQPAEEAKNAPMDAERIRKQLSKTGDSMFTFTDLSVECEGNVFMPVQALNKMRRDVLEKLKEEILSGYRRNSSVPPTKEEETLPVRKPSEKIPEFTAFVQTKAQFETVLGKFKMYRKLSAGEYGIYLASESFDAQEWKKLADRCHEAGVRCYLMMPRIFRKEAEQYFRKQMDLLKNAGFDALGIGSMEEPGFLKEAGIGLPLFFDQGMYSWNHLAGEAMEQYGADRLTVPVELNEREIRDSGIHGEMIVYGYLPMMISAQCIRKTTLGCSGKPEIMWLKDRKEMRFPVVNQCRFCYNTIYNSAPLSLLGLSASVEGLGPKALRLNFTVEEPAAAGEILDAFFEEYALGEKAAEPSVLKNQFTRGHFKRGVE